MIRIALLVTLSGILVSADHALPVSSRAALSYSIPCLVATDESALTIQAVKEELIDSDSAAIRWRNAFGMTGIDSGDVSVVSDTTVCTAVTHAINSAFHQPSSAEAYLMILKAGERYVAFAPLAQGTGQFLFILDLNYVLLHTII